MTGKILISTAYLPPVEYFSLFLHADEVFIEREENYLKQSYRNRCYILAPHGPQILSVPVYLGSLHKTPVKEIRIDYSKRWQQVHIGALTAAYNSSPYFQYYFENIELVISKKYEFLIELNTELTTLVMNMLKLKASLTYTTCFQPEGSVKNDYRYKISPKKTSSFTVREYLQVFHNNTGFVQPLSILDLIFNAGPEAVDYLQEGHAMA